MKIRLVTVVWGDFFIDVFLRVTVRSLLAEGNAGDLATRHSVLYTIQTTAADKRTLEQSPVFQELAAAVPIVFQVFNPAEINPNDLAQHWYFWRQVAEIARPNQELLFFIIPDMLFGAGTLLRWIGFFEEGRHAVWSSVPQVVLETTLEELEKRFPSSAGAPIALDVAEVHRLFLRQMHPYMITMFRDGQRWLRHPEVVFTSVPGEGLAMRAICSHLFCIDLNHFTLTDAFSPIDRLEDIAYDQLSHGVCLERLMKHADLYYRPNQMDSDRLSNLGKWLDDFCTPADMLESYHTYRFCGRDHVDDKKFRRAEASLSFYSCQIRLTGGIYRVARKMREAGCTLGAKILATAHFAARLRRHWRIKGEATLFVPADSSIVGLMSGPLKDLLAPGNEKALINILLAHTAPGKLSLTIGEIVVRKPESDVGSIVTETGSSFHFAQQGPIAQVVAGPFEVDDCVIYVIDRPLSSPALQQMKRPRQPLLSNRWVSNPRRAMEPVALPAEININNPSQPPRQVGGADLFRIGKSLIVAIPGVRWLAHKTIGVLRVARHPRRASLNAASAVRAKLKNMRRVLPGLVKSKIRIVVRSGYHTMAALPAVGRIVRRARDAYYATPQAQVQAKRATPVQPQVPAAALERLYDIQAAQAVLNIAELLRFYAGKVVGLVPEYTPLEPVEKCLKQSGIDDGRLMAELRHLLETQPDFSEAWLELGYAHYDHGNVIAAEWCWTECLSGNDFIAVPGDRVGCKALAAFAKAKTLEKRGRLAAAAEAYGSAIALDGRVKLGRLAYAKLLRRLGRMDDALAEFEASLDTDGAAAPFGTLPRTFPALSARLSTRFPKVTETQTSRSGVLTKQATRDGVVSGSLA